MKIETVGGAFNYFIREKVNLAKCQTVEEDAFRNCNLKEVKFTKNIIKLIKESAFKNNPNLNNCNYYDAQVEDYAFSGTPLHIKTEREKEIEDQERKMWFYRLFGWLF